MKVACSVSSLRQRCSHGLIDDYALVFLWNLPQMCCAKRRFSDGRSGATTRRAELTSMTTNPIKHSDSTNTAVGPIRCTVNTSGGPLGARGGHASRRDGREGCTPAPARRLSPAAKSCHSPPAAARGALSARKGRFDVPKRTGAPRGARTAAGKARAGPWVVRRSAKGSCERTIGAPEPLAAVDLRLRKHSRSCQRARRHSHGPNPRWPAAGLRAA